MRIALKWIDATRRLDLRLAPGTRMLKGAPVTLEARLIGNTQTTKIVFKGEALSIAL
jgi:hypothetical protein